MNEHIKSGPIAWMAKHRVAANLLMFILILGGLMGAFRLKQEVFPEFSLDMVLVSVPYPGASPAEVEQGIILAIEEKVRGLEGIKQVNSTAKEGVGIVILELRNGVDANKVLSDVKNEVDGIITFPEEAEEHTVSLINNKRGVISLILSGPDDLKVLHNLGEKCRAELLARPEISQVDLNGLPPLEMEIAISQHQLESWGVTLDQVAAQVRAASLEMASGALDTKKGKILVRLNDRRLDVSEFEKIPIRAGTSGTEVSLGEIATIRDGYQDIDQAYYFEGKRALELRVSRIGDETPTDVANSVKEYLRELKPLLPDNINIQTWNDDSQMLRDRIQLLVKNALMGLTLVLIILGLFLHRRLAFWVALGIPISFLGAFLLMGWAGISINMVTLFALIITLGMVVDDAIVVAENVFTKTQDGVPFLKAAVEGTREMAQPVTFSVLTTMTAFSPLLFVPGIMGKIFVFIPVVVIFVLFISLVECYFILPAHLGHGKKSDRPAGGLFGLIDRIQEKANAWLDRLVKNQFQPFLRTALHGKFITISVAIAILVLLIATLKAGILKFTFFPQVEGDIVSASIRLPFGVPMETTESVAALLLEAEKKAAKKFGEKFVTGRFLKLGEVAGGHGPVVGPPERGSHLISMQIALVPSAQRKFTSLEYSTVWKKYLPKIPGIEAMSIGSMTGPSAGKAIDLQLSHFDENVLAKASIELTSAYKTFSALTDIESSYSAGKSQLDFKLKPGAQALGITSRDVARTLRGSFFGAEALREQRGRNEMKVMVRLPKSERSSEGDLDNMLIRTVQGGWVRLGEVASFEYTQAPTEIKREDGRRVINVSAELVPGKSSVEEMSRTLNEEVVDSLLIKYPSLRKNVSGMEKSKNESLSALGPNYILALFVMFAMLAIPFRSYAQPLVVMSAIPFGFGGAIIGHLLLGFDLSFMSMLGIIALSGVVVNDSLVLVDAINKFRAAGQSARDAVVHAGMRRFRPIVLTSLTTFFGLVPMILETSPQARFLIPMAISLGFGALFVTLVVLIVVPALYVLLDDVQSVFRKKAI